ncbi:MAG: prenyltransferase [Candidatus Omnitrophica bacterium]|nr:prenyltransferase [Candidatus Omnitrophota bacterium]MDD5026900.1 prenyltransferase [Candidatus Omnitrophota bacterium]MDD5662168.1 prenyltransferase [Candidatus Omnitrophota bacterium]
MLRNIICALRLPFIGASILPFILGSLITRKNFNYSGFLAGLSAVIFTHLSANLINDYLDSESGADWQDKKSYGFFGGSKLIQEGRLSAKFYLRAALLCAGLAGFCVIILAALLKSYCVILIYLLIIIFSWQYTARPLSFSYNYLGELSLFLLFGPATVMGGYFIQSGIFPDLKSFILSLPAGFFTSAILFANEIPDFPGDSKTGKNNLVSLSGPQKAFGIYYLIVFSGFCAIGLGVYLGYLGFIAVFSFVLIFPALKAGMILKENYADKARLIPASKLAINIQMLAGIILILGLL